MLKAVSNQVDASNVVGMLSDANMPAGSVVQVVHGSYDVYTTNSSTTYADTGLSATITPSKATNKVLVLVSHPECGKTSGSLLNDLSLNIVRDASQLVQFNTYLGYTGTAIDMFFSASYAFLDSPNSTSALTYKTQFKNGDNNGAAVIVQGASRPSTITLLEIVA